MIKRVRDINALGGGKSPLFPLIYADFYYSSNESDGVFELVSEGQRQLLISLKNGTAVLVKTGDNTELEELYSFLSFWNVKDVLSDFKTEKFNNAYPLLKCLSEKDANNKVKQLCNSSKFADYEKIYNLLNCNGENFSEWFTVFSRKINNNDAVCCYFEEDSFVKSLCLVTAIFKNSAVISGVVTSPEYRSKGLASMCVKGAVGELYKRKINNVYLWCEKNTVPFYKSLGFKEQGEVYILKSEE